jgi:hypothetical protein
VRAWRAAGLASLAGLALSACEDSPNAPAATVPACEGATVPCFEVRVNGDRWVASNLRYDPLNGALIAKKDGVGEDYEFVVLVFPNPMAVGPATFMAPEERPNAAFGVVPSPSAYVDLFLTTNEFGGALEITQLAEFNQGVTGTFAFEAKHQETSQTMRLTRGTFAVTVACTPGPCAVPDE